MAQEVEGDRRVEGEAVRGSQPPNRGPRVPVGDPSGGGPTTWRVAFFGVKGKRRLTALPLLAALAAVAVATVWWVTVTPHRLSFIWPQGLIWVGLCFRTEAGIDDGAFRARPAFRGQSYRWAVGVALLLLLGAYLATFARPSLGLWRGPVLLIASLAVLPDVAADVRRRRWNPLPLPRPLPPGPRPADPFIARMRDHPT